MARQATPKSRENLRENRVEVAKSDAAMRKGLTEVFQANKVRTAKKNKLKDPTVRQNTLDFIFGKLEENPLQDKKEKI